VLAPLQARLITEVLSNARDLPPEVRAWLEAAESGRGGGYGLAFMLMLVAGSLIAAAGGAAAAAYFRKGVPPALGGPIPPPPA
jgi:cytochrome b561